MARRTVIEAVLPGVQKAVEHVQASRPRTFMGFELPFLPKRSVPAVRNEFYTPAQIAEALTSSERIVDVPLSTDLGSKTGLLAGDQASTDAAQTAVDQFRMTRTGLANKVIERDMHPRTLDFRFVAQPPGHITEQRMGVIAPKDIMASAQRNKQLAKMTVGGPRDYNYQHITSDGMPGDHTPNDIAGMVDGIPAVVERKNGETVLLTANDADEAIRHAQMQGPAAVKEINTRTIRRPGLFQEPVVAEKQ